MRKKSLQLCGVRTTALGGFTVEGPYFRRSSRIVRALDAFFYWLGA
ncbi:hypothetical protein [Burkholderia ubonensis]|nr:hypothetical protein [Burkholderia ubonensis]